MAEADRSRRKNSRRFTLRTLFILLSAACLACGFEANRLRRRAQAVALLNYWQQWVHQDFVHLNELPDNVLPDWAHEWLPDVCYQYLGVDAYPAVCGTRPPAGSGPDPLPFEAVERKPPEPTTAQRKELVAAMAVLKEMGYIQISFELDDEDLRALSVLEDLKMLSFKTRQLTEAGVAHIRKHSKLRSLFLDFDSPEHAPLKTMVQLGGLPRLESLVINGPISDADSARLRAALPQVEICPAAPVRIILECLRARASSRSKGCAAESLRVGHYLLIKMLISSRETDRA